jgi:protein-S-isoprenylcysteine O-methyltransferase Ste14
MSLMPAFEIGVWNAWILVLALLSAAFVPFVVNGEMAEKRMEGAPAGSDQQRTIRVATVITHGVIMPFSLIYSVFVPIQLGTWWSLAGLLLYLAGVVIVLMSCVVFATAPLGEPLTKGVYAMSRHPMYLGFFLAYAGIGLVCASWLFLLCALVWILSMHFMAVEEERILLAKYGDPYQRYMNRTPRWLGFPAGGSRHGLKPLA